MQDIYLMIALGILFLLILLSKSITDNNEYLDDNEYNFRDDNEDEEQFYHPTTGYKGTKSEMDAYIKNREKSRN